MSIQHYEQLEIGNIFPKYIPFLVTELCPGPPAYGACEFCPGPCSTESLVFLNTEDRKMFNPTYEQVKEMYKMVVGRNDRINYWRMLREMKEGGEANGKDS